jgi:hypothetical protein
MDNVISLIAKTQEKQYICNDCFGALFHWYENRLVCVACLSEFNTDAKSDE